MVSTVLQVGALVKEWGVISAQALKIFSLQKRVKIKVRLERKRSHDNVKKTLEL